MQQRNAIIVGCGGVGTHLAYLLSKLNKEELQTITLIDNDNIERKNLERQLFIEEQIGQNKAEALATILRQTSPDKTYYAYNEKIENSEQLRNKIISTGTTTIFGCTDNKQSKRIINETDGCSRILAGCDQDMKNEKTKGKKENKEMKKEKKERQNERN